MEILKPILNRRSVRRYQDKPVEDEQITALLESARRAPSGDNSQPWNFIYVIAVICVGYAVKHLKPRVRKPLKDMVHYERWGKKIGC